MIKNIFSIIGVIGAIAFITVAAFRADIFAPPSTAFAVGDLTINWGVPDGDPIFTIPNFAPGQTESRHVLVTNNAATARPLGVRGTQTGGNGISDELAVVIAADGVPLYGTGSGTGPKTLSQFFTDSAGMSGIALLTLGPGGTTTLTFTVTFATTAGNDVQNQSVTFDITLGIAFDVPAACEGITFAGDPIFGTQNRDVIRGTAGNDLIITFEGNDSVRGESGDDCIITGAGNNRVRGDEGNDVLITGAGNDSVRGDAGDDILEGEAGNDRLSGDAGDDRLSGGEGNDNLRGGNGIDHLFGDEGNDQLRGDAGSDHIEGGNGNDTMRGDTGNDVLIGGADHDTARGDTGTDQCEAEVMKECEL